MVFSISSSYFLLNPDLPQPLAPLLVDFELRFELLLLHSHSALGVPEARLRFQPPARPLIFLVADRLVRLLLLYRFRVCFLMGCAQTIRICSGFSRSLYVFRRHSPFHRARTSVFNLRGLSTNFLQVPPNLLLFTLEVMDAVLDGFRIRVECFLHSLRLVDRDHPAVRPFLALLLRGQAIRGHFPVWMPH